MSHRIERVNSLIRQEISELLQRQVKDPRLGNFVSVTAVSASPDLRSAKIFVSCLGSEGKKQEILTLKKICQQYRIFPAMLLMRKPNKAITNYGLHLSEITILSKLFLLRVPVIYGEMW